MVTENKAKELARKCLDEMYKTSTPPISWKGVLKKYGGTGKQFFLKHKLADKDYNRIKAKYAKKMGMWGRDLDFMLLNYSPCVKINKKEIK